jgi:hypothetical protein
VAEAIEDAGPAGGHGPGGFGRGHWFHGGDPPALAESLGVDEDELRDALRDGRTIAEVAEEQGVDVQDVVDAVVAAHQERVDEAVADGDLTQEDADELMAGAEERVTAFVNGERPDPEDLPAPGALPGGRDGGPWGGGTGGWHHGDDEADGGADDSGADDSEADSGGADAEGTSAGAPTAGAGATVA